VTTLAAQDAAQRRLANFYRGTLRDPSLQRNETSAFSNEQIAQAVIAIMRGPSGDGAFDPVLASGIAGQLALTVNEHLRGIDPVQLAANGMFKQLVSQRLDGNDANRRIENAAQTLRHANVTSADSAAAQALLGDRASLIAGRSREGVGSGARFDAMADTVAKRMDDARTLAVALGMGWAANNPELLRLGPGAIKTLHDAGVQRERFERMTGDKVGFRAATAVDIAAFARRHNLTPAETNRLYDRINDGVEIISGGNRTIQRELDEATRRYVIGPDTPAARQALERAYQQHANTPEKQEAARTSTQALIAVAQQTNAKVVEADAKVVEADAKVVKAGAKEKTTEDLDLYAQAAAPDAKTVVTPTKQTDAGTAAPNTNDKTKTAAVVPPAKTTTPKPA
jgi:hypothetical protein